LICGGDFYSNALVNGKCVICAKEYPNENSLNEVLAKKAPNKELITNLTEARVKTLIYEILEQANITRKKCEKCGKLFFPKSPAAKFCSKCREAETKETK